MKRSSKTDKIGKADKKAKRNVKIKFTLHLQGLVNLSPALNDSDVSVAWKRGSKKANKVLSLSPSLAPIYIFLIYLIQLNQK
jgi:hypothetical protein